MQRLIAHMYEDCLPAVTHSPHVLGAQHNGTMEIYLLLTQEPNINFPGLVSLLEVPLLPSSGSIFSRSSQISSLSTWMGKEDGQDCKLVFYGSELEVINITVVTFHGPQFGCWVTPNCKGG